MPGPSGGAPEAPFHGSLFEGRSRLLFSMVAALAILPTVALAVATWWVERGLGLSLAPRLVFAGSAAAACVYVTWLLFRRDQRLRQMASRDWMTGLFNHRYFHHELDRAIAQAQRFDQAVCVMMIDVDRFKEINDEYGHQAGDRILKEVGRRLRETVREYDIVARYGGEEFGLVLAAMDEGGIDNAAERLRASIARDRFEVPGGTISTTISVGFAVYPHDGSTPAELIERADVALYECKAYGRNQLRRWSERSGESAARGVDGELAAHHELIEQLTAIVDQRDGHAGRHSREVARWTRALAGKLDVPEAEARLIEAAALVHDIGKIGVPDGILAKPETLSEQEWDVIREHPGWGAEIVSRGAGLKPVARLVEQHQEWFDGSGYPSGLTGEQIEPGARMIAIVDAFHAIVNDRPWRGGKSLDEAVAELERGAGSQFDPQMVSAFVDLVRAGVIEPERPSQAA